MKKRKAYALTLLATSLIWVLIPLASQAQPDDPKAPRFWKCVDTIPAGAKVDYSYDGVTWTQASAGQRLEYSNSTPIWLRNTGTVAATIHNEASSTGDPNAIDKFDPIETLKPGTVIKQWPGTLLVIVGSIIGVIKGVLGIIGGLFSCTTSPAGQGMFADISLPDNPEYSVTISVDIDSVTKDTEFWLMNAHGDFSIPTYSDADPTLRYLATAGDYVVYDSLGNFLLSGNRTIPTLSEWGMIIFCALLFGWMAWMVVRRRKTAEVSI